MEKKQNSPGKLSKKIKKSFSVLEITARKMKKKHNSPVLEIRARKMK
jgi:hypothetical protein